MDFDMVRSMGCLRVAMPSPCSVFHTLGPLRGLGCRIFYDFGMMGSICSDIREGLVETFYGVYEKDPDKVRESTVVCISASRLF